MPGTEQSSPAPLTQIAKPHRGTSIPFFVSEPKRCVPVSPEIHRSRSPAIIVRHHLLAVFRCLIDGIGPYIHQIVLRINENQFQFYIRPFPCSPDASNVMRPAFFIHSLELHTTGFRSVKQGMKMGILNRKRQHDDIGIRRTDSDQIESDSKIVFTCNELRRQFTIGA